MSRVKASPTSAAPKSGRVIVSNLSKQKIIGTHLDAHSEDLVVLCHGYACHRDSFHLPAIADALAKKKISSLRFDFSGNGESEGLFEFGNYLKEVQDIRTVVEYARDILKKNVIAVIGHSKGGNDALLYAAQYDDVPIIINVAGRCDMKRGVIERFGQEIIQKVEQTGRTELTVTTDYGKTVRWVLTKQSLHDRFSLDMAAAVQHITISEVLTIHGTADTVVPVEDAQAFAKLIKTHTLCIVDGADHNFTNPTHSSILLRRICDFVCAGK